MTLEKQRTLLWCFSLLASVVALGCGGSDDDGSGKANSEGTEQASVTKLDEESPLGRSEPPPPGVKEQVTFFASGDGACDPSIKPSVTYKIKPLRFRVGDTPTAADFGDLGELQEQGIVPTGHHLSICLGGFMPSQPVEATFTFPDGSTQTATADGYPGGPGAEFFSHSIFWVGLPTDELGEYEVEAQQGSTSASNVFELVESETPGLNVFPVDGKPGDAVALIAVGMAPNASVPVDLYAPVPSGAGNVYATTLEMETDASGGAVGTFPTDPSDTEGCYVFRARAGSETYDENICLLQDTALIGASRDLSDVLGN